MSAGAKQIEPKYDTAYSAAEFDVNKRLTEHLISNAIPAGSTDVTKREKVRVNIFVRTLAFLALFPLLALGWIYSSLFARNQ